jgi:hypothetical protein
VSGSRHAWNVTVFVVLRCSGMLCVLEIDDFNDEIGLAGEDE